MLARVPLAPETADHRCVSATSTSVLAGLIGNVAGDRASVVSIAPVGTDPQQYEPTRQDAVTLSRAGIFFADGLHYEDFLGKLVESAGAKTLKVVTLSDGLATLNSDIDHGDHGHPFVNPFLYLDVRNAMAYVEKIRDALAAPPSQARTTCPPRTCADSRGWCACARARSRSRDPPVEVTTTDTWQHLFLGVGQDGAGV